MAVVLTHESQVWRAVLAMCVVVGVTLALSTATSTWSPGTALLQAIKASATAAATAAATFAAAAPAAGPAAAPPAAAAAADEGVCQQHRQGVGANGVPRGALSAGAVPTALPHSGMQAAHQRRLDPTLVRMAIHIVRDIFTIIIVALSHITKSQGCSHQE